MSKDKWFGTALDGIYNSTVVRCPKFSVFIWNQNRTTINDIVLGQETSPKYDISKWVMSIDLTENVTFENNEDAVVSSATIVMNYDQYATPIEITERTMLDGTPVQIWQGDERIDEENWIPIFTGFIQGNPEVKESGRPGVTEVKEMLVNVVDRAAAFSNNRITGRSYPKGTDIGEAFVETAIIFMGLLRREIKVGFQDYQIAHVQAQLVDIDVMNGLHQMLFTVGKKPRFNSEGFLVAIDADLDKAPARIYENENLIVSVKRESQSSVANNSVRLLGLDDEITRIVEQEKRLAHGSITTGFFEDEVNVKVNFSEDEKETGGRKAIETDLDRTATEVSTLGELFQQEIDWIPQFEADNETVFGGKINFDTGFAVDIRILLTVQYAALAAAHAVLFMLAGLTYIEIVASLTASAPIEISMTATLISIILSLTELGRVDWAVKGKPVQYVYQQLCSTAQLANITTDKIREIEIRNDWLHDIIYMDTRAKELVKRELVKGWIYEIEMMDDPLIDIDDVIQIIDRKYYVTKISKALGRTGQPPATMTIEAWRVQ